MNNKEIYETDSFWLNQPSILFMANRLVEFVPSTEMTFVEKLNAIVRFSFYLGITLLIVKQNYLYLYIPLLVLLITYGFYTTTSTKDKFQEEFFGKKTENCQKPQLNNPFMNVLLTDYKYNPNKPPACTEKQDNTIHQQIEDNFNFNLYQNIDDIYGNVNSQRQYFTMPSTTIPNDLESFSKWLYQTPKTLKESNICNDFGTTCDTSTTNDMYGFRRRDYDEHISAADKNNEFMGYDPSI